jgi:hypothetical protein
VPIKNVTRLCATGTVNTSPCFLYPSSISLYGPCKRDLQAIAHTGHWPRHRSRTLENLINPPMKGMPS